MKISTIVISTVPFVKVGGITKPLWATQSGITQSGILEPAQYLQETGSCWIRQLAAVGPIL